MQDMKILQVRWNKMEPISNTACKTYEIARNENTSCDLKKNFFNLKYFMEDKWDGSNWKYFLQGEIK